MSFDYYRLGYNDAINGRPKREDSEFSYLTGYGAYLDGFNNGTYAANPIKRRGR